MALCVRSSSYFERLGQAGGVEVNSDGLVLIRKSACNPGDLQILTTTEIDEIRALAQAPASSPSVPVDTARIGDMSLLWGAFVGVLVVVWGLKQLQKLFTDDRD